MPTPLQPFSYTKKKQPLKIIAVLLVVVLLIGTVIALSREINNNASIRGVAGLRILVEQTSTTVCPTNNALYSDGGTIQWGTVDQGTSPSEYVCLLNNAGFSTGTITLTTTLASSYGTISPTTHTGLAPGVATLLTITWTVSSSAPTGEIVGGFTITLATAN